MFRLISIGRTLQRYWNMAHDPRTPPAVRYLIYGGLAFTVVPKKWLPEPLHSFGLIDDAVVLPGVITLSMMMIPQEVKQDHAVVEEKGIEDDKKAGDHYVPPQKAAVMG